MAENLREKIDQKALAGLHRVIPASGGEAVDAYLTSGSVNIIIKHIIELLADNDARIEAEHQREVEEAKKQEHDFWAR